MRVITVVLAMLGSALLLVGIALMFYGFTSTSFAHTGSGPDNLDICGCGFVIAFVGVNVFAVWVVLFVVRLVHGRKFDRKDQ